MFGDNDLPAFFADFGVQVQFAGSTAVGILDRQQVTVLADAGFGGISLGRPTLQLPYNAFTPMPAETDVLNVDGKSYSVADSTAQSDGAVMIYVLKEAD